MATFHNINSNRKNAVIYNISCVHIGSRACHEKVANELVERIADEKAYATFGGDQLEGKPVRSNHFDPHSLVKGLETIDQQVDYFVKLVKPISKRILMIQTGNHELYLLPDHDVIGAICDGLRRPEIKGDYQAWVNFCDVTMHFWHGRSSMPRGAKDPIKREANQKEWLKNKLQGLAGSADAMYMAHTHHCLVVPPTEKYALLDHGEDVHGEYFTEQPVMINGKKWVPYDARWYVNTGTLRRGGGFGHQDYSEIAGYNPPAIGCTKTTIRDCEIVNIEKVLL